ncbi:hypothetical protein COY95_00745 [Candidatus Woesearchaeota archaeon CG_4_10_14_0_8_um_filter_47_5]|nr:MAG: hypothetical protein COY95_00745 [Candidatus Woesearchaeota archaeon CG_4_10_14_0_8_um_filter_47_5]
MGLFSFGKKDEPKNQQAPQPPVQPRSPPSTIPVQLVMNMRSQGFSDNQIIQTLQQDGYTMELVFNAMNQADMKNAVASPVDPMLMNPPPTEQMPPSNEQANFQGEMSLEPQGQQFYPSAYPQPAFSNGSADQGQPYPPQNSPNSPYGYPAAPLAAQPSSAFQSPSPYAPSGQLDQIEQIAESIIDEKWRAFDVDLKKVLAWKQDTEQTIQKLAEDFEALKEHVENLSGHVTERIDHYDAQMTAVSTEMKAMEKAFKKIIPAFTENVKELSRIAQALHESKKEEPPSHKKDLNVY